MGDKLLIEPHYLGSLEYYTLLTKYQEVTLEIHQNFTKQSYKNRCYILTAQGVMPLMVPVKFGNRTPYKEVKIDNTQSWKRDHWGAIYSGYGKSPFFEYFADDLQHILQIKHDFLLDLNVDFMTFCLKVLRVNITFDFTNEYIQTSESSYTDFREVLHPKKHFADRKIYIPNSYGQNFGNEFAPNLSILDLMLMMGTESVDILRKSEFSKG
ncbi:WbqC family protein [Marinoscillum sp. MHG1-6]|uniref:WbqC family protein n=1 Tax=Marinoscillum sp. MHG1-6 TaxID=2959627 RepID=UPI00215887FE|nr:WbqC family protein [Marinoscillum sp. MHG1-6]